LIIRERYLFKFYYIGSTKYFGSQRQPNERTIESELIKALAKKGYIHNLENSSFEVASRTDKLVSARGAAFSLILEKKPILMEINTALPKEMGLWAYSKVPIDFFSRFSAKFRHYKYIIPLSVKINDYDFPYDVEIMKKACKQMEGKHDFSNFAKLEKWDIKTIRDILSATVTISDDYLIFDFKSKAFLRQQIRRMVAKIVELGQHKISYDDFIFLFNTTEYVSFQPADPEGLILWDINYGEKVSFENDQKSIERMKNIFNSLERGLNLKRLLLNIMQHNNIG